MPSILQAAAVEYAKETSEASEAADFLRLGPKWMPVHFRILYFSLAQQKSVSFFTVV